MKSIFKSSFLFFAVIMLAFLYSCQDRIVETRTFTANKPVYMTFEDMRVSVKSLPPTNIKRSGKFYFYENYVFINEYLKGIHIIDNSDPSNPRNIQFIEIPGNIDMVIKEDYMYVDSYVDLVVLNIQDIENIVEVFRVENVFPYQVPEYDLNYPLASIDQAYGVVVGYTIEEVSESYEITGNSGIGFYKYDDVSLEITYNSVSSGGSGQSLGVAGSMARFSIFENSMYLLNEAYMYVYDITHLSRPVYQAEILTNTIAETLFLYDEKLFMGTQTGMIVYGLSNPSSPQYISEFQHIQSCDPVVVLDDYAYVTLRSGNACGGFANQLDVVDISDINTPQLVKSYEMTNPHGLGIQQDKTLFICDGDAGLKVYDASDPLKIDQNILYHFPQMNAFDVIPLGNLILLIGSDGLYQYQFEEGEMTELSFLAIGE
jgi:hypothetical protein